MARRLSRPRQIGRDLLVRVGARTPDQIDPIETAKELGIEVTFGHLKGATARIFRIGRKARIRVSDEIVTKGRRRNSIAHEVGHFALGHELPTEGDAASCFKASCEHRSKRDERDADIFAVEHLLPEPMVAPYCKVAAIDLHAVSTIERVFVTSPVMSAMRLVELSAEACAVVYSERGAIKWMKPSRSFPTYVVAGRLLAPESLAFGFFDRGTLIDVPTRLRGSAWLGPSKYAAPELEIVEHAMVIPEPGWGGVMSVLWLPDWKPSLAAYRAQPQSSRAIERDRARRNHHNDQNHANFATTPQSAPSAATSSALSGWTRHRHGLPRVHVDESHEVLLVQRDDGRELFTRLDDEK